MANPITNAHLHVFTADHAPDDFLRIQLGKGGLLARPIKWVLENTPIRKIPSVLKRLLLIPGIKGNSTFWRTVSFLETGLLPNQREIWRNGESGFSWLGETDMRFVPLSLNMDHMTDRISKHTRIDEQLEELANMKRYAPNQILPFLSVDPRLARDSKELLQWVQKWWNKYPNTWSGLKLYPALGYFPFDERLFDVYAWAEKEGIPFMTHCTRAGVYYIGTPSGLRKQVQRGLGNRTNPTHDHFTPITNLINAFLAKDELMKNENASELFGNPYMYVPVLDQFPKLKLCLAHFGGSNEVIRNPGQALNSPSAKMEFKILHNNIIVTWADQIRDLIASGLYPNLYTDISYTLCDIAALKQIMAWASTAPYQALNDKVVFGTDFFMILNEGEEDKISKAAYLEMGPVVFNKWARINTVNYLGG